MGRGRGSARPRRRPWDSNSGRKTWSEDRRGQDRRNIVTIQLGPPGLRLQCYRCLFLAFQSLGKQWSNRHNTNDRNYIDRRGLSLHNHILLHNQKSLHNCTTCSIFPAWLSPCHSCWLPQKIDPRGARATGRSHTIGLGRRAREAAGLV